jgi:hypothetical protein
VLQLGHVFLGGRFFRERPGQHEFGLENGPGRFDTAIKSSAHPSNYWVPDVPLDVRDHLTGIRRVPLPVQVFSSQA